MTVDPNRPDSSSSREVPTAGAAFPNVSQQVNTLLFDYLGIAEQELLQLSSGLPPKILRWLGAHHPDNRTRKLFFELTGVQIGEGTVINSGLVVSDNYQPLLHIGRRVAVSPNVTIICASSPNNSKLLQIPGFEDRFCKELPVSIGDDAWIGAGTIILPGVEIGSNSVVGAGAVVTRSVPGGAMAVGNPASVDRRVLDTLRGQGI